MAEVQGQTKERSDRRVSEAVVVSDKRDKTRKSLVEYLVKHPRYNKYLRKRTILHVHDERNASKTGDKIEIMECRPISKQKNWRLVRVITKAKE